MVIPEVVEGALTAAQMLDMSRKKKAVASIINQAVVVAAGVGATPIPFADAAILVPIQVTMIARITAAYGLPPNQSKALAVAGAVVLTGGATMAGEVRGHQSPQVPARRDESPGQPSPATVGRCPDEDRWHGLGAGLRVRAAAAPRPPRRIPR
ncbi:MAG: DUF697 domain-containing protein [Actinobacteria bacterium]|nr:DUF697 domain-containing protein [Actinomycetota bacterium]